MVVPCTYIPAGSAVLCAVVTAGCLLLPPCAPSSSSRSSCLLFSFFLTLSLWSCSLISSCFSRNFGAIVTCFGDNRLESRTARVSQGGKNEEARNPLKDHSRRCLARRKSVRMAEEGNASVAESLRIGQDLCFYDWENLRKCERIGKEIAGGSYRTVKKYERSPRILNRTMKNPVESQRILKNLKES